MFQLAASAAVRFAYLFGWFITTCVGVLVMVGSSGHVWELWSCVGELWICVGKVGVVVMCGSCGYVWELCIYVGKLGVVVSLLLSILSVA